MKTKKVNGLLSKDETVNTSVESLLKAETKEVDSSDRALIENALKSGKSFLEQDISGKDLGFANLAGGNFIEANFSGSDLSLANLEGAAIKRANLSGTKLRRTKFKDVLLGQVDLRGADLSEADFSGAKVYGRGHSVTINKNQLDDLHAALGIIIKD